MLSNILGPSSIWNLRTSNSIKTRGGVAQWPWGPFTLKSTLKAKEELWKFKYISACKNILFEKSSKRNQNPSSNYNSL
jgi:hypothetical protein